MGDTKITERRHGAAITLGTFLLVCAGLSVAPLPLWLKPFQIGSIADAQKIAARVLHKPRMTLAEHEEKLAGGAADGRDAPEGQGIEAEAAARAAEKAREEQDLYARRDARADVEALQQGALHPERAEAPMPAAVDRAAWVARVRSPKADRFREQARGVKANGAPLDNPCVEKDEDRCVRTALEPLFSTLDALARNEAGTRAEVLVLGNSLIASDHVTDVVRTRLVERFGDGGRGFLLPDRLSKVAGRRVRTGAASAGWDIATFAQDAPKDGSKLGPFGFSGSFHVSTGANEKTSWATDGATRARLFYLEHAKQPAMRLEAITETGTTLLARVEPAGGQANLGDEILDVQLPRGTRELQLVAEGKGATVYGVALERDRPGVVLDTIGVPAANVRLYMDGVDEGMFVRQVAARDPSLVVLMLGGNEARALDYGTLTLAQLRGQLDALVTRLKKGAPEAACLLVAPIDAAKATAAGEELVTRKELGEVIAVQRAVAQQRGCGYFNLFEAMGGAGSLSRFKDKGFLSDDLVHPTWKGGDVLGQLFADALLDAYGKTPAGRGARVARRTDAASLAPVYAGLSFPSEENTVVVKRAGARHEAVANRRALQRVFGKLRALERGEGGRVAIGQIGASHTAGQMFTDRVRARLAERFGVAGRGFVAVGRSSSRLEQGGVVRALDGAFEIADGREVVLGGAVGMSGTKARLEPGARFAAQFCAPELTGGRGKKRASAPRPPGCSAVASPGFLQLAWLYTPDMGSADVAVDGKSVAHISAADRNPDSDVQLLRVPIDSESPLIEVAVNAPAPPHKGDRRHGAQEAPMDSTVDAIGPVNLLSVVEERDRPGVVLDTVGLPGTTGMTPQRWRQDLVASEVAARNYDLLITAWGTNEAGIASLDEATYKHHFGNTLRTLLQASPRADCLIVGASDRFDAKPGVEGEWRPAPSHELVERVQRELAAEHGCAFYSMRTAMGGPGSMKKWAEQRLGHEDHVHFTEAGYRKLADAFVDDLFAAFGYDALLVELQGADSKPTKKAEATTPPAADEDRRGG